MAERVNSLKKYVKFNVPRDITYDPAGPRANQIVILTASDGKGHNGGIQDLIGQTRTNRQDYADLHGYHYHFINITKYDLQGAHPVWAKLPAVADAFNAFPDAQWVWWLDLDAIIMTPTVDLNKLLLSHEALGAQLQKNVPILRASEKETGVRSVENPEVKDIDFVLSQDGNGPNAGSFFIRRSQWTRMFLDMWSDPMFINRNWVGQEQDAIVCPPTPPLGEVLC